MKRFIVAVSGLTSEDEKAFIDFLSDCGVSWWHRIPNFWLLVDGDDKLSAKKIRDHLRGIEASTRAIVMENRTEETWSGFQGRDDNVFKWLHRNWVRTVKE